MYYFNGIKFLIALVSDIKHCCKDIMSIVLMTVLTVMADQLHTLHNDCHFTCLLVVLYIAV